MKKIIQQFFALLVVTVATAPLSLFAQGGGNVDPAPSGTVRKLDNPLCSGGAGCINNLEELIKKIIELAILIGVPIITIAIIWSGFQMVTAAIAGNEAKLTSAKKYFVWALIGAGILLGAWVIAEAIGGTVDNLRS